MSSSATTVTRCLVTGFGPFGGESTNPSWDAVRLVADSPPEGVDVTARRLSCVYGTSTAELRQAIAETRPDLVLCVGLAGGRSDLTVERVAVNLHDAPIPDNSGRQPVDEPAVPGGPTAYFASLPVKACVAAVRALGLPASVSHTAGTFVCNHVFYGLAHLIATELPELRGGFVHVPFAPDQIAARTSQASAPQPPPSMSVRDMAAGLAAILETAARTTTDLHEPGGATH